MNTLNYASLEASKRLVEAGIVLETEAWWMLMLNGTFRLVHCSTEVMKDVVKQRPGSIPAPCMAEVWRELPEGTTISKDNTHSGAFVIGRSKYDHQNDNPTDALIDLLIWVRQKGKE